MPVLMPDMQVIGQLNARNLMEGSEYGGNKSILRYVQYDNRHFLYNV